MNGSNNRYLFDTNAVIYLLRGNKTLLDVTAKANWLGVSVITHIEFLAFPGMSPEDTLLFTEFLRRVEVIGIDCLNTRLISTTIKLRQEYRLKLPDAIITASAIGQQASLVTADRQLLDLGTKVNQLVVLPI